MATTQNANGDTNTPKTVEAETTQVTKNPLPFDMSNSKIVEETTPRAGSEPRVPRKMSKEDSYARKPNTTRSFLGVVGLILLLGMLAVMVNTCNRVEGVETGLNSKADKSELAKKVDQTAFDSLKGTVDTVSKSDVEQTKELKELRSRAEQNAKDIDDLRANKVDQTRVDEIEKKQKTELSQTRWNLRRVERKLDARIAAKEAIPMPVEEKSTKPPGTVTVIVRPVPASK